MRIWFVSSFSTDCESIVYRKVRPVGLRETMGDERPCDACDQPIGAKQKAVLAMVSLEWMSVRFHVDCYKVWDAERLALAEKTGNE